MLRRIRRVHRNTQSSEALETRYLLSTITVTSSSDELADDGAVTLREAIQAANSNESVDGSAAGSADDVDVIEFADGITSIELTSGQFELVESITIRGPESRVVIDAMLTSRHFEVTAPGAEVTLENLRLTRGTVGDGEDGEDDVESGGAVRVEGAAVDGGSLSIINSVLDTNTAELHGGAVVIYGDEPESEDETRELYSVVLRDSTFSSNVSGGSGGSVLVVGYTDTLIERSTFENSTADNQAGGVMVFDMEEAESRFTSTAEVIDSTFTGNVANGMGNTDGNGAGFYYFGDNRAVVSSSTFTDNTANYGGGVMLAGRSGETQIIRDSTVTGNTGRLAGGGISGDIIEIRNTLVADNTSPNGGGIAFRDYTDLEMRGLIENSTVRNNIATQNGGGISAPLVDLAIRDSRILDNQSSAQGGGVHVVGTLDISRTSVAGNNSETGGGLYLTSTNPASEFSVSNSTIAHNSARTGGGVFVSTGVANLRFLNSTIARNQSQILGGGIHVSTSGITTTVESSIVAENTQGATASDIQVAANSEIRVRNSLIGAGEGILLSETGGVPDSDGNLIGSRSNPIDAGLTYTGTIDGAGPFIGLQADSPAIDAGSNPENSTIDHRGADRVVGAGIDMGAFEGSPERYVEIGGAIVTEGDEDSQLAIDFTIVGEAGEPVLVEFMTEDGTALADADYTASAGSLQFDGTDGETQTVEIAVLADDFIERTEQFGLEVTITGGTGGFMIPLAPASRVVQILDADQGIEVREAELLIAAGDEDDSVSIAIDGENYNVTLNGETESFAMANISSAFLKLRGGNDNVDFSAFRRLTEILTGSGNDTVLGSEGVDSIRGGDGDDSIVGNSGRDFIVGGNGNDTLLGSKGFDQILGADGDDLLLGQAGGDSLIGGHGNDELLGGRGRDTLLGNTGADSLNGGSGSDSVHGGSDGDTLIGGSGFDSLFGDGGSDSIRGGADSDRIRGGTEADTLFGEDGNDSLFGGDGDDLAIGGAGSDSLEGEDGNDNLRGSSGNDRIEGGEGNDTLRGEEGNDLADGGNGDDVLLLHDGDDTARGGDGDDLIKLGFGDNQAEGNAGDDTIAGGSGADLIEGGDGNDRIDGLEGRDFLIGGLGRDTLRGGDGDDLILAADVRPGLFLPAIAREWASTERDYATRAINIRGRANRTSDRLNGNNYLRTPGQVNSTIVADNTAGDVLRGGEGQDYFLATKSEGIVDRVFKDLDEVLARL